MNTEEIELARRAGQGESTVFDLEGVSINHLAQTLAAFANGDGGIVVLGIDPKTGAAKGIRSFDAAVEKALSAGLRCDPPLIIPRPERIGLEGKDGLLIEVPAGLPHAYCVRGQYPARSGKKNVPLGPRQLRQLLRERGEGNFEVQPAPEMTLDDLDDTLIQRYAAQFLGEPAPTKRQAMLDVLCRRGCLLRDGSELKPTVSGCLLFGQEPQLLFPSAEILLARYSGKQMADEFLRETVRGPLPEQLRRAEGFVVANMRKGARIDGLQRADRAEYPIPAVREAIVNAVAHRDYGIRGDEIRVLMFSDRIEVYSPGRLPGHVTLDNLVDERFSRNEVITQVLADLGYVERLGYGIDRMIRLMKEYGLPAPRFAETSNGFRVTLRGPGDKWVTDDLDRTKWRRLDLNERQEGALEFLHKNSRITNREYRDLFSDVSEETIRRDLADLVEKGVLLKMGDKKGTYYIAK